MDTSKSLIVVTLTSGNLAVYEGSREYGQQVAHELDGAWYMPGGWKPADERTLASVAEAA